MGRPVNDWWNNPKVGDVEKAERLLDNMGAFETVNPTGTGEVAGVDPWGLAQSA